MDSGGAGGVSSAACISYPPRDRHFVVRRTRPLARGTKCPREATTDSGEQEGVRGDDACFDFSRLDWLRRLASCAITLGGP